MGRSSRNGIVQYIFLLQLTLPFRFPYQDIDSFVKLTNVTLNNNLKISTLLPPKLKQQGRRRCNYFRAQLVHSYETFNKMLLIGCQPVLGMGVLYLLPLKTGTFFELNNSKNIHPSKICVEARTVRTNCSVGCNASSLCNYDLQKNIVANSYKLRSTEPSVFRVQRVCGSWDY